nr:immunoglobulin heavy chain junction region [Macaca mulatta]
CAKLGFGVVRDVW